MAEEGKKIFFGFAKSIKKSIKKKCYSTRKKES